MVGSFCAACGAGSTDAADSAPDTQSSTAFNAAIELEEIGAAIDVCSPSTPWPSIIEPDGQCVRIRRAIEYGKPFLDAYTSGNGDVVTRDEQSNDTQLWCFTKTGELLDPATPSGAGVVVPYFTIQHRAFSGQFLDAYTNGNDYRAVLRDANGTPSQEWVMWDDCGTLVFQQRSVSRYLDGHSSSANNYRAVTRTRQYNGTQNWLLQ